jgi:hypothetical protein
MTSTAARRVAEQDDLHNSSVLHPATSVPARTAVAQALGTRRELLAAVVAGYGVGIRVGVLGRSHYTVFHTTGTANARGRGATGRLLGLTPTAWRTRSIGRNAGRGPVGFLRETADSKQLHAAHAAFAGLLRRIWRRTFRRREAHLRRPARDGRGPLARRRSGAPGRSSRHALGTRRDLVQVHASCRHTPSRGRCATSTRCGPACAPRDIVSVTAHHRGAIDVLGPVVDPQTVRNRSSDGHRARPLAVHG